jgi:hypothetical protein
MPNYLEEESLHLVVAQQQSRRKEAFGETPKASFRTIAQSSWTKKSCTIMVELPVLADIP